MNWQSMTMKDLEAAVEVLKELPYKNLAIGRAYSRGLFGMAYDSAGELMGEMESLTEFDTIEEYRSHLEDVFYISDDEDEDDDREYVAECIANAEKIGAPFAVYSNGREEIYTKDGDREVINEYLSDAMNGHSFSGTKEEAIELIEEQIATGSILPMRKDVAEIVSFVAERFEDEFDAAKSEDAE